MHCADKSSYIEEINLPNITDDGFKLFTLQKWLIWINLKYKSAFDIVLFGATDPKTSVWYPPSRRHCPEVTFSTPDANFLEFVRLWSNSQIGGFWKKCDNDSSCKQTKSMPVGATQKNIWHGCAIQILASGWYLELIRVFRKVLLVSPLIFLFILVLSFGMYNARR